MHDLPETWRPVPGAVGAYEASSIGRVRSIDRLVPHSRGGFAHHRGRVLVALVSGRYRHVNWFVGGKRVNFDVHRIVCSAFHGEPQPGQVVRHLDGDRLNNCASNLTWGTPVENAQDKIAHGTNHEAKKTHCPKLHPYDELNTYRSPTTPTKRNCRACSRERDRLRWSRRRAAQLEVVRGGSQQA